MTRGHQLAEEIAAELPGEVREVPVDGGPDTFVVALPDGRVPILVRSFGHAIGVCVAGSRSWSLPGGPLPVRAVREVVAIARTWAQSRAPDAATLADIALHLAAFLSEELGQRWTVSIPGTPDPEEMWLHGADHDAASVGIFAGRVVIWLGRECREVAVPRRPALAGAAPAVLAAVREQLARHARHVAESERLRALGTTLASLLAARLGRECKLAMTYRATYAGPVGAAIRCGGEVVDLRFEGGAVRAHAGLVGDAGWDGEIVDPAAALDDVVAALERARVTLTLERLEPGRRYRVRERIQALAPGAIVRFEGFDDVDNHFGRYVFTGADGRELAVEGDFSTPRSSPLAETHRYLEEVPDQRG